jgi:shikimate kinase
LAEASRNRPIALLGMRGSGKSTLGALLAESLRRPFFDLDRELELAQGRSVAAILREDGEAAFRALEAETLAGIVPRQGTVLATGGGIVERDENRTLLRSSCRTIWLDVPVDALVRRLAEQGGRPPLTALAWDEEVRTLATRRAPLYREAATDVLAIARDESVESSISRLRTLLSGP